MQRRTYPLFGATLLSALILVACGTTSPSQSSKSTKPAQTTQPTPTTKPVGAIQLSSPVITQAKIPARYSCDGANIAPPLQWGPVPPGITELVLFALDVQSNPPNIEWAMGGLKPTLHKLTAGALPSGAFLEQASDGKRHYSICPAKGKTGQYEFLVYALPIGLHASRNITGFSLLHNLTAATPEDRAPAEGGFNATYKRK